MIIFFGIRSMLLKKIAYPELKCAHCHMQGTVSVSVFQRYLHVFFIPFLPIAKSIHSYCSHCQKALVLKNLPESKQKSLEDTKVTTPFKAFIGLFITLLIIGGSAAYYTVQTITRSNHINQYLSNPKINDIYVLENDDTFLLMKITEIEGDKISLNESQKAFIDEGAATSSNYNQSDFFSSQATTYTKNELDTFYKSKILTDIIRN